MAGEIKKASEIKALKAHCEDDECHPDCVEPLVEAGLTEDTFKKAKAAGFSFSAIIAMVLTYGPVAVKILQNLLDQLKQVAPLEGKKK